MLVATPEVGRRKFIVTGMASAGALLLPHGLQAQQNRVPTPRQTAGPFYPVRFPDDVDNDLVVVRGAQPRASGVVTHVMGRVLGTDGRPIPDATVEIWQCDAHGRYLHPADTGKRPRDTAFQGYGRMTARADSSYVFRTIRPVAYPGRTPHIHFAVRTPSGRQLVTQMYVAGEPLNAGDSLYASIRDPRQREAVTVALAPANGIEPGALGGNFDIVLPT
jgi:protocatechuate 3,4-dioxygenase, beta subunit